MYRNQKRWPLLLIVLAASVLFGSVRSTAAPTRSDLAEWQPVDLTPPGPIQREQVDQDACPGVDSARCFEALAAMAGRAEAWYRVYGAERGAVPRPDVTTASSEALLSRPDGSARPPVSDKDVPALTAVVGVSPTLTPTAYLPLVLLQEPPPMVERRAVWVTRYDWTRLGEAPTAEAVDTIVAKVAEAGFNTVFFQVRAAGDAYYTPGLEPWAARLTAGPVSETLGLDPGWDPLARMLSVGHAAGLEVHAYVNVYTAWLSPPSEAYGDRWPPATTPPQMFDRFTYGPTHTIHPGEYGLGWSWRHYSGPDEPKPMNLDWGTYLWASPGLDEVNAYIAAVVRDIVRRYPVDGVHLDLVRYAGVNYSYDPASNTATEGAQEAERAQWQRDRITALVGQVRKETHALRPGAMVSAAVWPYYIDKWGWGLTEGYHVYYQDSKGWLATGAVDAIAPMLYGTVPDVGWQWETLMLDFLADSQGKPVYPGIGAHYKDFTDVAWRIERARAAGAPGHVLFSFSSLDANDYWDDLAAGPYRRPAILP